MATKTKEQIIIRDGNGNETKFSAEYGMITIFTPTQQTINIDKKDWVVMCAFIDEQLKKYIGNE
jgi:hypothetical protein